MGESSNNDVRFLNEIFFRVNGWVGSQNRTESLNSDSEVWQISKPEGLLNQRTGLKIN